MNTLKVGIAGGAGYTGGELLRLLLRHPFVEVDFVQSRSMAGKELSEVHSDLLGDTQMRFAPDISTDVDLLFLCMPHGEAAKWLAGQKPNQQLRIIDLSHDFRAGGNWGERSFVYGLPELNKSDIQQAELIANPGCYATAIQLALLPLAAEGLLKDVYVTGITGATGAGQSLSETSHFPWRHANVSAYKTLTHQHLQEIHQSLRQGSEAANVLFVPWRGDFPRGIFVSCIFPLPLPFEPVQELYTLYYEHEPFVHLQERSIDLKMAVNTNKCIIQLEHSGDTLAVHAAIDNLLKGAAGQAVQNMNLMYGFDEKAGLDLKASAF